MVLPLQLLPAVEVNLNVNVVDYITRVVFRPFTVLEDLAVLGDVQLGNHHLNDLRDVALKV